MDIEYVENGKLIPINVFDIPILSTEKDFLHLATPTLQHYELRLKMLEKIYNHFNFGKVFAEFGVYKGDTARKILNLCPHFEAHLFDSFEGLPEDWDDWFRKGYFALNPDEIPTFNTYNNVTIYKGYFNNTLSDFVSYLEENNKKIDFIHIDCDLYSSTKTVFDYLNNFIVSGTIIHFDELIGINTWYKDWRNGEYKALLEWAVDNKKSFEYIGRTDYTQVTIRIL